jgi:hypothetical protein
MATGAGSLMVTWVPAVMEYDTALFSTAALKAESASSRKARVVPSILGSASEMEV